MKEVSHARDVELVITWPGQGSAFGDLFASRREGNAAVTTTAAAFHHLACSARDRLVILSPFFDEDGAQWVCDMFSRTQASERILVLREEDEFEKASEETRRHLALLATRMLTYCRVRKPSGYETFHSKIVLADMAAAYIGSANTLWSSKEGALEAGVLVRDRRTLWETSEVVDTILSLARSITS